MAAVKDVQLMIAYISRELDMKHNAERHAEARVGRACCSVRSFRDRMIDVYSSRQENTHVEVAFPLSSLDEAQRRVYNVKIPNGVPIKDCVLAFGAFSDRGVVATARPFSNAGYRFMHMTVRREEFTRALQYALKQNGKEYDSVGASWRLMVWPAAPTRRRWWCASLTHAILQKAGILCNYPLNSLDVDDIVNLTKSSGRRNRGMTPRSRELAKDNVAQRLFGVAPSVTRGLVGEIATDVVDAVDQSCRHMTSAVPKGKSRPSAPEKKHDDDSPHREGSAPASGRLPRRAGGRRTVILNAKS